MRQKQSINGKVYKATSPSGKVYIGITITSLEERKRNHLRNVEQGSRTPFHNAVRKYGLENFQWEIVDETDDADELLEREKQYIKEFQQL